MVERTRGPARKRFTQLRQFVKQVFRVHLPWIVPATIFGITWFRATWVIHLWRAWPWTVFIGPALVPGGILLCWLSMRWRTRDRFVRWSWSLATPFALVGSGVRATALCGTDDGGYSGNSILEALWRTHNVVLVLLAFAFAWSWLQALTRDYLATFRFTRPLHRREARWYLRSMLWTALVNDASASVFIAATAFGALGATIFAPTASFTMDSPLAGVLVLVCLGIYLGPPLTSNLDRTARATYRRIIRDRVLTSTPTAVVLGYGRVGQRAVAEIVKRLAWRTKREFYRVVLPGLGEFIVEELMHRDANRDSGPVASLRLRFVDEVMIVDQDPTHFVGVGDDGAFPRIGLAVIDLRIRPPRRSGTPPASERSRRLRPNRVVDIFLVPAIVGDMASRDVLDRSGVSSASLVVSTVPDSRVARTLLNR